jgi:hypothetical protein
LTGVLYPSVFGVINGLPKASLRGFFKDFCAPNIFPATHHEHHGLFTAHKLTDNAINDALLYKGLKSWWSFHKEVPLKFMNLSLSRVYLFAVAILKKIL